MSHEENYNKVNDIVNICRHILRTADKKYEKSDEIFTNLRIRVLGHFRGAQPPFLMTVIISLLIVLMYCTRMYCTYNKIQQQENPWTLNTYSLILPVAKYFVSKLLYVINYWVLGK